MIRPAGRPLGADDRTVLAAEASGARMQFAGVVVLGGTPSVAALRALIGSRLDAVPRLRQRLVRVPGGRPEWQDDPDFDIARHIDEVACPPPGDRSALVASVAPLVAGRLTLARAPWRATLVRGLAEGRSAVVFVLHHVLADGLGALAILSRLADGEPAGSEPRPPVEGGRVPGRLRAAAVELLRGGLTIAPRCSINAGPVGSERALAVTDTDLAGVLAVAHAAGGTVNDVVLTAATGALGGYLAERGERVDRLIVSVPVAGRGPAGAAELGNRVGVLPVRVPVGGPPGDRLPTVVASTRTRRTARPGASATLYGPSVRMLAGLNLFAAFIARQRLVNVFLTNVRGPRDSLSFAGFRVEELIPIPAISGNVGVAFAVIGYAGRLTVTVVADPDRVPDVARLGELVREHIDALIRPPAR